jgi:hypothetical protein
MIIGVGTVMLLDNLGLIRAYNLWDYFPLVLIALGVIRIVDARQAGSFTFGGVLAAVGTMWFLHNIGLLWFNPRLIPPIAVIGAGVLFLVRNLERQRSVSSGAVPTAPEAQINVFTMFGGVKRYVDSLDFRTADLFAMFGGIEVDFRRAKVSEFASIEANCIFGGIEIRVPREWSVQVKGMGIFGAYEDKTLHPPEGVYDAPKVVISGSSIFGGVVVQSV